MGEIACIIYEVPPNIDPKTYAGTLSKMAGVRPEELEVEREKTKAYMEPTQQSRGKPSERPGQLRRFGISSIAMACS